MKIFKEFFYALGHQDFEKFSDFTNLVTMIYFTAFFILFLENGVLFAFFLPGDTLLFFIGILISKNVLSFPITLGILTVASGLGTWFSYLQGKWLKYHRLTKWYFTYLPRRYHHLSNKMFHSYGMFALFIGRFIFFVRTLLPVMIGLSKLDSVRFHFCNWISAFFWILTLTFLGFIVGRAECIQGGDEQKFVYYIMFVFIVVSMIITIVQYIRNIFFRRRT